MASSSASFVKTVLAPLLLALSLYLLLTFALLPLYRRHRARYSQYLPLNTNTLSAARSSTSSFLRDRLLTYLFLPSTWALRSRYQYSSSAPSSRRRPHQASDEDDDEDNDGTGSSVFGSDEGEGMVGFDMNVPDHPAGRRGIGRDPNFTRDIDIMAQQTAAAAAAAADSTRRLSRELEQGFRDDSDSEAEEAERRQAVLQRR